MRTIAENRMNRKYGAALIHFGGAKCRHSAAAAVFARLASTASRIPEPNTSADRWKAAARIAILNAGASEYESVMVVAEMVRLEDEAANRTDFAMLGR